MEWKNCTNTDDFTGYYGFIYKIVYTDGSKYYGKKSFISEVRPKPLKDGKKRSKIVKESKWRDYEGSIDTDKVIKDKFIVELAISKRALTYLEVKILFDNDVLFNDTILNKNIGGVYYDNVLDPLKKVDVRRKKLTIKDKK